MTEAISLFTGSVPSRTQSASSLLIDSDNKGSTKITTVTVIILDK